MIRILIIGFLMILVLVNVYFRTRILRYYKKLNNIEIPLKSRHIFSRQKLEEEILKTNEPYRDSIEEFVNQIRQLIVYVGILFIIIVGLSIFTAVQD